MDNAAQQRIHSWLAGPYDAETKSEIRRWMESDPKQLEEAFFKELGFGTGGMRGKMGPGTNRMNRYTVQFASQGLANYLIAQKMVGPIIIGCDVRHNSPLFAIEAARVFAGNGLKVLLIDSFCPTPLVSFGCRYFGCSAAIVITASHNPPIYNGYKAYWKGGAQVVPPHDEAIMDEVRKISSPDSVRLAPENSPLIHKVGKELDEAYFRKLDQQKLLPITHNAPLSIIYTNLHGTGIRLLPQALHNWGFNSVELVKAQQAPDGDFPNAPSPNPEERSALKLGTEQLVREKRDLLLASDPDADRLGAVALHKGAPTYFTGNQIACLCLYHICSTLTAQKRFPGNAGFVKSIVTTELFSTIAKDFGGSCIEVLTGFKYITEQIAEWEQSRKHTYLFGAEESYGYLFGSFVRDKDAISSGCLLAEAALTAKIEGKTLTDRLEELYRRYGVHREALVNLATTDSPEGIAQIRALMDHLRKEPPIEKVEDYLKPRQGMPPSDVLRFWLEDGSKLVVRPSGTEPKIKIYAEVMERAPHDLAQAIFRCDLRLKKLTDQFTQISAQFLPGTSR